MISISNNEFINISEIPSLSKSNFYENFYALLNNKSHRCVNYFAIPQTDTYKIIAAIADDSTSRILLFSTTIKKEESLKSITAKHYSVHGFEREIHENFGIDFEGHPWLKPLRYPSDRHDIHQTFDNYPFYEIEGEDLHEVGVGPIHAGIIEPGHFRFICNGEKVLHLEIVLGYQHRGVEKLMSDFSSITKHNVLSESIAGDTTIGHCMAWSMAAESLAGITLTEGIEIERTISLELERIAVHIGDTAALCGDIAYQLGLVACEALRTIIINTTQAWCGNRFGKGLIRPGGTNYPLSLDMCELIGRNITDVSNRYNEVFDRVVNLPAVAERFEDVGILTSTQARLVGMVGMAARASGLERDVRLSHPFGYYKTIPFENNIHEEGDVMARILQRKSDIDRSVSIIFNLLDRLYTGKYKETFLPAASISFAPSSICLSLVEGWRGEICHTIITDEKGKISFYKIKDPSFHNWMGLAIAMRNQAISDFPICNKSFNLSYCGHDL